MAPREAVIDFVRTGEICCLDCKTAPVGAGFESMKDALFGVDKIAPKKDTMPAGGHSLSQVNEEVRETTIRPGKRRCSSTH